MARWIRAAIYENSVQSFARRRYERVEKARQLLEQKNSEKNDNEPRNQINATISEDLADGYSAKLDRWLKILRNDQIALVVPTDEIEDDEIHLIESALGPGKPSLQDYQMQLMLLDQQNKKRRAQMEQDTYNSINSQPKNSRAHGENHSVRKRQKTDYRGTVSAGNHASGDDVPHPEPVFDQEDHPAHFKVVYTVQCEAPTAPRETMDMHWWHLNAQIPVLNLGEYLQDENDDVGFVIVRTVQCSESTALVYKASGSLPYNEAIYVKSAVAKAALRHVATCYYLPVERQTPSPSPIQMQTEMYMAGKSMTQLSYDENRIEPADLFFYHHRHRLREYITAHPEAEAHIGALLQHVEKRYGSEFDEAACIFGQGQVTPRHLAKLFKPNKLIVSGSHGKTAAFVVQEWPKISPDGWLTLKCWSFGSDGRGFSRKQSTINIPPMQISLAKIPQLVAFPLEYATSDQRKEMLRRGQKMWSIREASHVTYKGWNVKRDQFYPDSRFMIDPSIYRKMHQHAAAFTFARPSRTHHFDTMPPALANHQEPTEDSLLLMPVDVHGFYLHEKKWIQLFVDDVHPIDWNKKAYERLVLPESTKELVLALVSVRTSQRGIKHGLGESGKRTDITSSKGNGLIMLLHGGPGTGKTLTAESVAEIAEMPLYRVTCGDIGTNAGDVEKYLNTVLYLGKAWNCVLLLDEADVFLEERSNSDLERNSLVSVFLRILEYYDGILILTSNRIGVFDEAFKSRIQVALHYENLNRAARKKIWQNFLDMLEEDEEDVNFHELQHHLDELASKELNGRQIRNSLTTARQLAIHKGERLDWPHLQQALAVSSNFNDYLRRMQGHTDDQWAKDSGVRL